MQDLDSARGIAFPFRGSAKRRRPIAALLAACLAAACAYGEPGETAAERDARLAWWREARFGMFIHWGPVSVAWLEISWSRANTNPITCPSHGPTPAEVYDNLYRRFDPAKFDAAEWVSIAKAAGMKYMVLTTKHHDGFLLWPSKVSDYNIGATPFKRDVCAELAQAAHEGGMRIGWYFSPPDWHDPDCRSEHNDRFVLRMQAELRELLGNYGRIDLFWPDSDGYEAPWHQEETYALVRGLQPKIIINERLDRHAPPLGGGAPRPHDPHWSLHDLHWIGPHADYYTPEGHIGDYDDRQPWETCMPLGTQWTWKPDDRIKPANEVVGILARCAGGDGNLLLNIGPMPDGRIEPRQVDVLRGVGAWLQKNGESIYGTRGGPFKPGAYGASTRRGRTIFVHVLRWPDGPVSLPAIPVGIVGDQLLNGGTAHVRQSADGIAISVAPAERDPADTVVALLLDGDAMQIPAKDVPPPTAHARR